MSHANATLTPAGRLRLAKLVVDKGWSYARAAERFSVSVTTARRWADRYRELGKAGIVDRSSRPHRCPNQLRQRTERRIVKLRVTRRWGPARIAYHLGLNPSTVHQVLVRYRCPRLKWTDPATGTRIKTSSRDKNRYEHAAAGSTYRTADQLAALGPGRTRALVRELVRTLVALHRVDAEQIGLADFGRPEGFLARQVRRWGQQLERSRSRDLAPADELYVRLLARVPSGSAAALVHGDYRLDNLLFDPRDRAVAVLDWEMATVGDPLTDVGLLVTYDRLSSLTDDGPVPDFARAPGYPTEAELLDRYALDSGRDLSDLGFHLGLAAFKVAVILEGIHYRHHAGQTVGTGFDGVGDAVVPLLEAGLLALKEHS